MSDTPRTDAITFIATKDMVAIYNTVPAEFARELERELKETNARVALLEQEISEKERPSEPLVSPNGTQFRLVRDGLELKTQKVCNAGEAINEASL